MRDRRTRGKTCGTHAESGMKREINDENTEDAKQAKQLEASGVEKAEQGDLDEASECFNQAYELCSFCPSWFNNKAQLWR